MKHREDTHFEAHPNFVTRNPEKWILTPGKTLAISDPSHPFGSFFFRVSRMQVVHATTAVNVLVRGFFLFLPPNVRVSPGWAKKDDMDDIPFKRHRMSHDGSKNTPVLVAN